MLRFAPGGVVEMHPSMTGNEKRTSAGRSEPLICLFMTVRVNNTVLVGSSPTLNSNIVAAFHSHKQHYKLNNPKTFICSTVMRS